MKGNNIKEETMFFDLSAEKEIYIYVTLHKLILMLFYSFSPWSKTKI